jgi:hypothetical protein
MPLDGLTSDESNAPSFVVIAFFNESINAVTWGSLQKSAEETGADVDVAPGTLAVSAPVVGMAVSATGVEIEAVGEEITGNVSVAKRIGLGVAAGACVADGAHAAIIATTATTSAGVLNRFVFITLS